MSDDTPTPRLVPFVDSAATFRAIAEHHAKQLDAEASESTDREYRAHCQALAMRMRAFALEFAALDVADPGDSYRRAVRARWIEALNDVRFLNLQGLEFGS